MNNSKINIVKSVMKLLRIMFKNEKVYFLYVFLNIVSSGLFAYTLIQIPKIVLTQLETNHLDLNSLIFLFSLLTICGIGSVLMKYLYTPIGFKIRYNLLADVIETMLSIPLSDFENPKYLDNMWIITSTLTNPSGIQAFYTEFANFFFMCNSGSSFTCSSKYDFNDNSSTLVNDFSYFSCKEKYKI